MFPEYSTGISVAGAIKWLLVVCSLPLFVKAWQGLVNRSTATSYGRVTGEYLSGDNAAAYGWQSLGKGVGCVVLAWAVWFFWQRNED